MISQNSKAQTWSIDIAIAVVVFLVAFFAFYSLLNPGPEVKINTLEKDAAVVIKQITSEDPFFKVLTINEINESRLAMLKNTTYVELKKLLRIEGDFCIYFEDESGYVIVINNTYKGIGAPTINLTGVPCNSSG